MTVGLVSERRRRRRLFLVRGVHTVIYVILASACLLVLHAGIFGWTGPVVWIALGLVAVEVLVFTASGMKCPLTVVAVRYGATPETGYDTFFPETMTRHTARVFTPIIAIGAILVLMRHFALL